MSEFTHDDVILSLDHLVVGPWMVIATPFIVVAVVVVFFVVVVIFLINVRMALGWRTRLWTRFGGILTSLGDLSHDS